MFKNIKNEKIRELLFQNDVVPSTENLNPEKIQLISAQAFTEPYSSDKLSGQYVNSCLVLEFKHIDVPQNFFVHIFDGANRREAEVKCVVIKEKEIFQENKTLNEGFDNSSYNPIVYKIKQDFEKHWFGEDESLYEEDMNVVNYICDQFKDILADEELHKMAKKHIAEKFLGSETASVDFDSFINGTRDETNSDIYIVEPWAGFNGGDIKAQMGLEAEELYKLMIQAIELSRK